jgi:hypothetical protein
VSLLNDPKIDQTSTKRAAAPNWNRSRQNPQKAPYLQKSLNGAALNCV